MSEITVCLIIAVVTMILFIGRIFPMALTSVLCALAMGIFLPSVKLSAIYSGFGTAPVYMIAGMTIVGDALFQTGVAQKIGISLSKMKIFQNERIFTVMVVIVCVLMSAFMSDSGCIAMWMPIIAAVAAGSKGKIRSKMVIMPAGIACIVGGATTLVGSTSQNTANSFLMQVPGFETGMGVFDMTSIMWMVDLLMIIYFGTIGYTITKKTLKPGSPYFDDGNEFAKASSNLDTAEQVPQASTRKQVIAVGTLLLCILGFILCGFSPFNKYLNIANVALIGASILFVTKTIDYKQTLKNTGWDVLLTVGFIATLGVALEKTGAGKMIAEQTLAFFGGENASLNVIMCVMFVLGSFLTLFMSNVAVSAMLAPIYIPLAQRMGISPVPFIILIAIASNMAIATPIGTPVNMQILPAGYKFSDYVKIGGPLWLIFMIAVCLTAKGILF